MLDLRVGVDLAVSLVGALVCAAVGLLLWRRSREPRAELEVASFAWGWAGLALEQAGIAVADALVGAGVSAFLPFRVAYLAILGGMALALGAFLVHAFAVLGGRRLPARWGWLAGVTYFVFFGLVAMLAMGPASIREPGLSIDLPRITPLVAGILMVLVIAPLFLPIGTYLAAIARGHSGTRRGRSARYRAVLIACCFLLAAYTSFGISLASLVSEGSGFEIGLLVVSLVAPLGVLMAYRPPAGVRDALQVEAPRLPTPLFER